MVSRVLQAATAVAILTAGPAIAESRSATTGTTGTTGAPGTVPTAPASQGTMVVPPTRPRVEDARALVESEANTKTNLKQAIDIYTRVLDDAALAVHVRADGWADMARAYLRLGDLETVDALKIAAYEKGRAAAARGIALDGRHVEALFWDMANLASIGRTRGVMNSLFMLPELRKGLGKVIDIDTKHSYAHQTLAEIDHAVPGLVGGSDERAEKRYLDVLRWDPGFTPTMVNLAEMYRDQGKPDLARQWANKVLNATRSSVPNDWQKFDKPDARKILRDLD